MEPKTCADPDKIAASRVTGKAREILARMKFKALLSALGMHPARPAPMPPLRPEQRLCIVGDLHGRIDLLDSLLMQMDQEAGRREAVDKLVFLGDYIDRGETSAQVLHRLHALSRNSPEHVVCLRGNHEQMLLNFLDTPQKEGRAWLRNGGLQTLASFGVGHLSETAGPQALVTARDRLRGQLPDGLENWLRTLPLTYRSGNLCAVHASLDPSLALSDQPERALLWGSAQVGNARRADELWVIHGHTVVDEPMVNNGVISIDTGAYATNLLSAALIDPSGEIEFIQAKTHGIG